MKQYNYSLITKINMQQLGMYNQSVKRTINELHLLDELIPGFISLSKETALDFNINEQGIQFSVKFF